MLDLLHDMLGAGSGVLVGFTLGLVGGGGSILAVPLMVYVVGVASPHLAIGTSALAVAANAALALRSHARAGNVNWRCGFIFGGAGVAGALAGSTLGKALDGQKLLFLFALLMIAVAAAMFAGRKRKGEEGMRCTAQNSPRVVLFGLGTGLLSGFFGIGGGFLIVPALVASTRMPTYRAIGTSLVAVTAFGLSTATNYALSGLVDWRLAAMFIAGGLLGTAVGAAAGRKLSADKGMLGTIFAAVVLAVALYMLWRSSAAFFG